MTHRATIELKSAYLNSEFGQDYACCIFGLTAAELEVIVGRYSRGKRKGELRYQLSWKKCTRGGWYATGPSMGHGERTPGHVKRPGETFDHAIIDPWAKTERDRVLWHGERRRLGFIPGETQEQFEDRMAKRRAWLAPRQDRAFKRALAAARKMSDHALTCAAVKREFRPTVGRYPLIFVAGIITYVQCERLQAHQAEMKKWAEKELARP